jgi:ribosomal protein S18 acetylase RimI-like enzyme
VELELRPSTAFTARELAALFTASYEGYFVPFEIDGPTFVHMVEAFDLDLAASLVAVDSGTPIGLANLGRREERTWLGGIGVVLSRRRGGVGELLARGLLDRARRVGAREMVLEVITENAAAIALYEKLGFRAKRELEIFSLARADGDGDGEDVDAALAARMVAQWREAPEAWQRDDATLANLSACDPAPRGLVAGAAAAVYRLDGARVGLIQAAGDPDGLRTLLAALRRRGTVSAVNYPADGSVAQALRSAGADVVLRQLEMSLLL